MLRFDQQWLDDLDVAVTHDRFVLQKAIIIERAKSANTALYSKHKEAQHENWLNDLLQDAARVQFELDDLPLLYNDILWQEELFYREPAFEYLFKQVLLHSTDRVQQLHSLLKLQKNSLLTKQPYYADLDDDPLNQHLTRIRYNQDRIHSYQDDNDQQKQLHTEYLALEYRALLLALLSDQLGGQAKHWRGIPCDVQDLVHIENVHHQRTLKLRITLKKMIHVESQKQEKQQVLLLALPATLETNTIDEFNDYLDSYLQQHQNAEALVTQSQKVQQASENQPEMDKEDH